MELIIKNDSNVKVTIFKDEVSICTRVANKENSTSVFTTTDSININTNIDEKKIVNCIQSYFKNLENQINIKCSI